MSVLWTVLDWSWWLFKIPLAFLLGVFCTLYFERRFERWLDRTKLEITAKTRFVPSAAWLGKTALALELTVTNRSEEPIEPFSVWHELPPNILQLFERQGNSTLSKDQREVFWLRLFDDGTPADGFAVGAKIANNFNSDPTKAVVKFVVDNTNGERILYESKEMGRVLAQLLCVAWKNKDLDGQLVRKLNGKPESDIQWFLQKMSALVENDLRQWFTSSVEFIKARPAVKWILGAIAALCVYLFLGFLPFMITRDHQDAANIGDSFGLANAFFAGLALAGAVYTIYLQHNEMKSNEETQNRELENQTRQLELQTEQARLQTTQLEIQSRQVEVSQRVARVQALSFLADFQYRLTHGAPPHNLPTMLTRVHMFKNRAIELLGTLGEEFDLESDSLVEIPTIEDRAAQQLKEIAARLREELSVEGENSENTKVADQCVATAASALLQWSDAYAKEFGEPICGPLRGTAAVLQMVTRQTLFRPISEDGDQDWKQRWFDLQCQVDNLAIQVENLAQELLGRPRR